MKRVHTALQLRHHKHTGKLLPHKHTSYGALFLLMCVPIALLALVGQFAAASDYAVTATVPAPMPSGAPTITSPTDGAIVNTSDVVVSGTCPVITPAVIIAIYDGGTLSGSTVCSAAGDYSVTISLSYGVHTLVATVVTITGQTGASSPAITVTRPSPVAPSPSSSPTSSSSSPSTTGSSLPSLPGVDGLLPLIRIITNDRYVLLDGTNHGTWHGAFNGGVVPYKVTIDWGDGAIDHLTVNDQTERAYNHQYGAAASYPIAITVTDQQGNTTTLQSVAVTFMLQQKSVMDLGVQLDQVPPIVAFIQKYIVQIYIVTLSSLLFLWYLEHGREAAWDVMFGGVFAGRRKSRRTHRRRQIR